MKDDNFVFWQEEVEEKGTEPSLNLLLCCNAGPNEDWLKSNLHEFEEIGRSKNITELRKVLKTTEVVNLAIIMRKTGDQGVDKPEQMAQIIKEHSPNAEIFIIVGKKDEHGVKIVEATEKLGCRTLIANKGPITAKEILAVAEELAELAKNKIQDDSSVEGQIEDEHLKVVYINGVKGGCGATTALAAIAHILQSNEEPVAIIDSSGGCKYIEHDLEDVFITTNNIPETGWILTDQEFHLENEHEAYRVIITDSSTESVSLAKEKIQENDFVVINRAEPDIFPIEIYSSELKKEPNLIVPYQARPYLLLDWDDICKDWQPLVNQLLEKR